MGAWGTGIRDNDTALDAIGKATGWSETPDAWARQVIKQEGASWEEKALLASRRNDEILALADLIVSNGGALGTDAQEKVLQVIQEERSPKRLEQWSDPDPRREALDAFRQKVLGKRPRLQIVGGYEFSSVPEEIIDDLRRVLLHLRREGFAKFEQTDGQECQAVLAFLRENDGEYWDLLERQDLNLVVLVDARRRGLTL